MARVAVVGGGWAGLAAAVAATRLGHHVTLLEATRTLGGRARALDIELPDGAPCRVDNGQHILIGAYTRTLELMESVGVRPADVLLRLPLTLRFPDGGGLALPDWRAPYDAAAGILQARGWSWGERLSLLRASLAWRASGFRCAPETAVADLCRSIAPRVVAEMIEPLCVSALNTPAARASGQVFLRVLRDSLFGAGYGGWGASNLLVPRADLGALLPEAAARWLESHGAEVRPGHRVHAIAPASSGWMVDDEGFEHVVLACPPWEAQRLVETGGAPAHEWLAAARGLTHEPITTVYAVGAVRLALPMLALRSSTDEPAQFVFDRSQLGGPAGLLAFVASASGKDRELLQAQVVAQAAGLGWAVRPVQTVVEKRATFACTPGMVRPAVQVAPRLLACGDYVDGPYPATLEGAVRSGLEAAAALS